MCRQVEAGCLGLLKSAPRVELRVAPSRSGTLVGNLDAGVPRLLPRAAGRDSKASHAILDVPQVAESGAVVRVNGHEDAGASLDSNGVNARNASSGT
jgi:hypothetical protein